MASVLDTSSIYDTYYNNINSVSGSSLKDKIGSIGSSFSSDFLASSSIFCTKYDSKSLQTSISSSSLHEDEKGEYMQYFSNMLNETYADAVVDGGGLGLAQQLYDSMKTQYNLQ